MAYVESNRCRIFFEVIEAQAPWVRAPQTVLFLHGIGIDLRMWTKWIPALADSYRLVLMDMRGFGRSTVPPAGAVWSMDELVQDVLAVARAAASGPLHFVGESMGATVGLCAYLRSPAAFRTLTVSNGAHMGAPLRNLDDWAEVIGSGGMPAWSAMMSRHRFYDGGLSARERAWFDAAQAACAPHSCLNAVAVLRGVDLSARLGEFKLPVLLLHGDASPFIPASISAALLAGLPDGRLQIFARAKHGLPLSHGMECARVLRNFLDERSNHKEENA
ncbi:MAG TPA: alpha/beta hydrolase [Burkholderiales bacterium]|nr:alpha/beta hydrolase [Burkholderiales bacterium]